MMLKQLLDFAQNDLIDLSLVSYLEPLTNFDSLSFIYICYYTIANTSTANNIKIF